MNEIKEKIELIECEIVLKVNYHLDEKDTKAVHFLVDENVLSRKEIKESAKKLKEEVEKQIKSYLNTFVDNPFINLMKGI